MKEKKYLIISLIFFTIFLIFFNFTIHADGIIETREVLGDGSILITFTTENGTILSELIVPNDIDLFDISYVFGNNNVLEQFGDDLLETTIWLPDVLGGCLPTGVCYNSNNNKYYFYSGRRLIIVDGDTNEVVEAITISNTGNIGNSSSIEGISVRQRRLVYNNIENKVYCITDGAELIEIDGYNNEVNTIFQLSQHHKFVYGNVNYNQNTNQIIGVFSQFDIYDEWCSIIIVYDYNTQSIICQNEFPVLIFDITTNTNGDKLFISYSDRIHILRTSDLTTIDEITDLINPRALTYNTDTHTLYVNCDRFGVAVIDGISNTLDDLIEIDNNLRVDIDNNQFYNKVYTMKSPYNLDIIDGYSNSTLGTCVIISPLSIVNNEIDNNIFCGGYDNTIYSIILPIRLRNILRYPLSQQIMRE